MVMGAGRGSHASAPARQPPPVPRNELSHPHMLPIDGKLGLGVSIENDLDEGWSMEDDSGIKGLLIRTYLLHVE